MSILRNEGDGPKSNETEQREIHSYTYGEATCELSWDKSSGYSLKKNPRIRFQLKDNTLVVPDYSIKRSGNDEPLGIAIDSEGLYSAAYNYNKHRLEFDTLYFLKGDFPGTLFEEIEHAKTFDRINDDLSQIDVQKGFPEGLPKGLRHLPITIQQFILKNGQAFKEPTFWEHFTSEAARAAATMAHEFTAKQRKVQKLLEWSKGDLTKIMDYPENIKQEYGSIERIYFEREYLSILLHAKTTEQLQTWAFGAPLRKNLPTDIDLTKRQIKIRLAYLHDGYVPSNVQDEAIISWIPEDYKSTALYDYLFFPRNK